MICSVFAAPPTVLPHAFYGSVTINSVEMPVDAIIYATCDENTDLVDVQVAGQYGGAGIGEGKLVAQGCSAGDTITFTVSVSGYTGTSSITDTYEPGAVEEKTLAFTGTASPGGGGSSSSSSSSSTGAAAASGAVTTSETQSFGSIGAGETKSVFFEKSNDLSIQEIKIKTKNAVTGVSITVEDSSQPAGAGLAISTADGKTYKYLQITVSGITNDDIESATIKFKIPKSWFEDNSLDSNTVLLNKYVDGDWNPLGTTMTSQDDTYYYYEATTSGFSYFAITAKAVTTTTVKRLVCGNGICETGENCGNCLGDCPCAEGYTCQNNICKSEKTKTSPKLVTILLLIFVTLAVIIWLTKSLKKEKPKSR